MNSLAPLLQKEVAKADDSVMKMDVRYDDYLAREVRTIPELLAMPVEHLYAFLNFVFLEAGGPACRPNPARIKQLGTLKPSRYFNTWHPHLAAFCHHKFGQAFTAEGRKVRIFICCFLLRSNLVSDRLFFLFMNPLFFLLPWSVAPSNRVSGIFYLLFFASVDSRLRQFLFYSLICPSFCSFHGHAVVFLVLDWTAHKITYLCATVL